MNGNLLPKALPVKRGFIARRASEYKVEYFSWNIRDSVSRQLGVGQGAFLPGANLGLRLVIDPTGGVLARADIQARQSDRAPSTEICIAIGHARLTHVQREGRPVRCGDHKTSISAKTLKGAIVVAVVGGETPRRLGFRARGKRQQGKQTNNQFQHAALQKVGRYNPVPRNLRE